MTSVAVFGNIADGLGSPVPLNKPPSHHTNAMFRLVAPRQRRTPTRRFMYSPTYAADTYLFQFGSESMGMEPIDWFQGATHFPSVDVEYGDRAAEVAGIRSPKHGVNSRDIKLHVLDHQRAVATRCGIWETTVFLFTRTSARGSCRLGSLEGAWRAWGDTGNGGGGGGGPCVRCGACMHACVPLRHVNCCGSFTTPLS